MYSANFYLTKFHITRRCFRDYTVFSLHCLCQQPTQRSVSPILTSKFDFASKKVESTLYIRVVPILQKLWYLKYKFMWSNTLLWGMFIPIFKILPLKLRCHWIAQFYEAISLNFRLIKYSDAWKLTFFSRKWSWNDSKVKYAWIKVKKCLQEKFGVNGFDEWDSMVVQKH